MQQAPTENQQQQSSITIPGQRQWDNLLADKPVYDFLVWSIINFALFAWAGWQVSALALVFSLITRDSLREQNEYKARKYSKLALVFNALSSVKGALMILAKLWAFHIWWNTKPEIII